ncbi:hypothetical protein P0082_03505 [Candidatus Haliotispira prima]|uniref:Uncharacterized protein n=1 Tax=Candidatus Haliotispira prima TaxID=3034016 RepID=A0ABY8ML82_9SPIO|nr:hypothetical protein P0082_03505 [Candidatus Haliotispira prima]
MASSVQLEVSSIPTVTDAGAVIHLAAEAVPTKTKALASKGYVSLSIDADSMRKFSISQHYDSNFEDGGFTLADVLAPNTSYKLYLYMPSNIDLGKTNIKGGVIEGDRVEISFTTASLPAAGAAVWSEKFAAKEYVASLNEYHFMESQTGVFIAYFESPYIPFTHEFTTGLSSLAHVGRYRNSMMTTTPGPNFYFNYGLVEGYPSTATSRTTYMIAADKVASPILRDLLKNSTTPPTGPFYNLNTPTFRY